MLVVVQVLKLRKALLALRNSMSDDIIHEVRHGVTLSMQLRRSNAEKSPATSIVLTYSIVSLSAGCLSITC